MMFQVNHNDNPNYGIYRTANAAHLRNVKHRIYNQRASRRFLSRYGYREAFDNITIHHHSTASLPSVQAALLRLAILYEVGGIYLDADIYVTPQIYRLPEFVAGYSASQTLMLTTGALYFLAAPPQAKGVKKMLEYYLDQSPKSFDVDVDWGPLPHTATIDPQELTPYFRHDLATSRDFVRLAPGTPFRKLTSLAEVRAMFDDLHRSKKGCA